MSDKKEMNKDLNSLSDKEIESMIENIFDKYRKDGSLPSPDDVKTLMEFRFRTKLRMKFYRNSLIGIYRTNEAIRRLSSAYETLTPYMEEGDPYEITMNLSFKPLKDDGKLNYGECTILSSDLFDESLEGYVQELYSEISERIDELTNRNHQDFLVATNPSYEPDDEDDEEEDEE